MAQMLQLRATLLDSDPEIWRRLLVDPRLTLEQLHTVLQITFGWTNSHLHQFHAKDGTRYGRRFDGDEDIIDERKVGVLEVFTRANVTVAYEYDFGDGWMHAVKFEKTVDSEKVEYPFDTFIVAGKGFFSGKERAAMCIAGARNGPPEDCGGVYGLHEKIQLKVTPPAKPTSDQRDMLDWLGDWEPDLFDLAWINQNLGRVRVKKSRKA